MFSAPPPLTLSPDVDSRYCLSGIVVRKERPELEEQKDTLVLNIASGKNKLVELENEILRFVHSSLVFAIASDLLIFFYCVFQLFRFLRPKLDLFRLCPLPSLVGAYYFHPPPPKRTCHCHIFT